MSSSGKQPQHAQRVCLVSWFTENLAVDNHYRVCTQDELFGVLAKRSLGLLSRQAFRAIARILSCQRYFRNVGGPDRKWNARVAQQFLAARRGGSEHQHRSLSSFYRSQNRRGPPVRIKH